MNKIVSNQIRTLSWVAVCAVALPCQAFAAVDRYEGKIAPSPQAAPATASATEPSSTTASAAQTLLPGTRMDDGGTYVQMFSAILVNPETSAQKKSVTIQVQVEGVALVDPDEATAVSDKPQPHLHYQLDQGPIIATTAKKLSFHQMPSGDHTITVRLAGPDHQPLGPYQTLTVRIP